MKNSRLMPNILVCILMLFLLPSCMESPYKILASIEEPSDELPRPILKEEDRLNSKKCEHRNEYIDCLYSTSSKEGVAKCTEDFEKKQAEITEESKTPPAKKSKDKPQYVDNAHLVIDKKSELCFKKAKNFYSERVCLLKLNIEKKELIKECS